MSKLTYPEWLEELDPGKQREGEPEEIPPHGKERKDEPAEPEKEEDG